MEGHKRQIGFMDAALERVVVVQALKVAAVVGTVLVTINQGDVIFSGGMPNWWKLGLTYCVPYCVSTYSAAMVRLAIARGVFAAENKQSVGGA